MFIHKETFYQDYFDPRMESHWVVQYWDDDPNGFPLTRDFLTFDEAEEFESELTSYDDWKAAQESLQILLGDS